MTAAYMYVDMVNRRLTCTCAGHPPLLLWDRSTAEVRDVLENGLFLGKFLDGHVLLPGVAFRTRR